MVFPLDHIWEGTLLYIHMCVPSPRNTRHGSYQRLSCPQLHHQQPISGAQLAVFTHGHEGTDYRISCLAPLPPEMSNQDHFTPGGSILTSPAVNQLEMRPV